MTIFLESSKVYDCPSIIILQTPHFFIFAFIDPINMLFPKFRSEYFLKVFGLSMAFDNFSCI